MTVTDGANSDVSKSAQDALLLPRRTMHSLHDQVVETISSEE